MLKISSPFLMKIFTKLLTLLVIAKALSLGALWYFPSDGIELNLKNNYQPQYQRVNFRNMLIRQDGSPSQDLIQKIDTSMSNMVLKGLYGNKTKGFVIIAMKANTKKTSIVGIGEVYKGFKLKSIAPRSAIFMKNSKKYILNLQKIKQGSTITKIKQKSSNDAPPLQQKVSRKDITNYANNPMELWKEISISEVKDDEGIKGFKVNSIKQNSKLSTLGLKKGDIIIKANNVTLKSYNDALNIYNNISKLKTLQIVVLRDNQEKELIYEID